MPAFPIQEVLPAILEALGQQSRLVLEAPPGAGKTTQVPLALLDAPWLAGQRILMLEPRRVAARAAATFMARQLGESPGQTVGYRIRFENRVSRATWIEVVTEGILTRMIQDDPLLEGVGAVLFDEFHERHLAADLGLALALDVQASVREDLRIVLMSATLDGERLAAWLKAPRISSAGRSFPVSITHLPPRRDEALELHIRRALDQALAAHPGDVLVFLPGIREIQRVEQVLRHAGPEVLRDAELCILHGDLPVEQQARLLQPGPEGGRRIVLATNVAESSVTLPGVRVVIDSGLAREARFDPNSGFSRLNVQRISQASAEQRAGRAGRVAEGWAYRLWPESERLAAQRRAEIQQVELAGLALELAAWGQAGLRFVDPPPPGALAAARDLLLQLDALDTDGHITAKGRQMLALGTHPRLAAMLLAATEPAARLLAADLAALLEARDPLPGRNDALLERWQALAAFRSRAQLPPEARRSSLAQVAHSAQQWRQRLGLATDAAPVEISACALGQLLAHAFPDRIAWRHPQDPLRYTLSNGRMARLFQDSHLIGEPWLVVSELRLETRDAQIVRAAPVDAAFLRTAFARHWREGEEVRWDSERRALVNERIERFAGIVLAARPGGKVDPARAAAALTAAVRELGLAVLPWSEATRQLCIRVQCLRHWLPDPELPDLSEAALLARLDSWLLPAFSGKTRLDALDPAELANALGGSLDWAARQRLERLVPTHIRVPSGLERRIDYQLDAQGEPTSPVLAVKLQELFGLAETPSVCEGRVPLTLHLLSPAGRPLQVTRDLASFWKNTYPEVKKEMKGRYPRHPWPDDPWSATATHRAKPRGH